MTSEKNYDELMYTILCSEGNIIGFFDKIFEFLYRRTDYFKIKKSTSSQGLEVGEAENIVRNVFCKYMEQAVSKHKLETVNVIEPESLDYITEEVVTTEPKLIQDMSTSSNLASNDPSQAAEISDAYDDKQQSEPKIQWMDPDCYNGARYDDYCWAQSMRDIDVRIKVPEYVKTGKQVKVLINHGFISTEVLYSDGSWGFLKKGDLTWKINVEESTWTLVPGEHIHICLQKLEDRWWDSFFTDEPKINLKSIDQSMPFEDLDEEAQAKIKELMYNEHQKRLGKLTIQQSKIEDILKEAWNSEGSPFKGQPYDPTLVDIPNVDSL